jgi:hypothetical protein
MSEQTVILDGLITFYSSHHALRAEKILKQHGLNVLLVPGPREISPNCGVALQFEYRLHPSVKTILVSNHVCFEAFHHILAESSER